MSAEKVMDMEQAMEYLKISSRSTFYKLLREGKIPYVNLNSSGNYEIRRFTQESLDRFLQGDSPEATEAMRKD